MKELRIGAGLREESGGTIRWIWPVVASAVVIVACAGTAWWLLPSRVVTVPTALAIATASKTSAPSRAVLEATGYVTARRQATVSSQITGTLTEVMIEEGDHVKSGQILARLDASALRAAVNAAEANVQSAQAQIVQGEAQLRQSQADEQRQVELAESGMVTRQAVEHARTTAALDGAQLASRRREADAAIAQLAQARVNLDYTLVRAPFSGVVTNKAAQVGEIVSPLSAGGGFTRTGVGTIVDMDSLEVDVDVSEALIGQVKPDMPCEATLDAYPDWKIPAHVIAVVPAADRGKATIRVRVGLEQKDVRILPDIGVRISFLSSRSALGGTVSPHGVLVPRNAIVERDGHPAVFVVREGKVQLHLLSSLPADVGSSKLLPDSVEPGDRVVLSPPITLVDGARVAIGDTPR